MNRLVIDAIAGEFRRYKTLADKAASQLADDDLHVKSGEGNSVATLLQHLGGNLRSRFHEFLTADGEKQWRNRDGEFEDAALGRSALLDLWEDGWRELFSTLGTLEDGQLSDAVTIRGVSLSVIEALTRSLAHTAYHVGQIVLIARGIRGAEWEWLSIPPRGSAEYNAKPVLEKPPG